MYIDAIWWLDLIVFYNTIWNWIFWIIYHYSSKNVLRAIHFRGREGEVLKEFLGAFSLKRCRYITKCLKWLFDAANVIENKSEQNDYVLRKKNQQHYKQSCVHFRKKKQKGSAFTVSDIQFHICNFPFHFCCFAYWQHKNWNIIQHVIQKVSDKCHNDGWCQKVLYNGIESFDVV